MNQKITPSQHRIFLFSLIFISFCAVVSAQTLVNTFVVDTLGHPVSREHYITGTEAATAGIYYITGSTFTTGRMKIL